MTEQIPGFCSPLVPCILQREIPIREDSPNGLPVDPCSVVSEYSPDSSVTVSGSFGCSRDDILLNLRGEPNDSLTRTPVI